MIKNYSTCTKPRKQTYKNDTNSLNITFKNQIAACSLSYYQSLLFFLQKYLVHYVYESWPKKWSSFTTSRFGNADYVATTQGCWYRLENRFIEKDQPLELTENVIGKFFFLHHFLDLFESKWLYEYKKRLNKIYIF
jgi:hypothetical protein